MTHRHDVWLDKDYSQWLRELKERYRRSQIKASVRVNAEKMLFNWQLGRDLALRKAEERWGSGIVEQVSPDLRAEFPGDGFSARNVCLMKQWYLFYSEKLNQLGAETANAKLEQLVQDLQPDTAQRITKLEQVGGLLICAGMDETEVQYSFRGVDTPMGVAAYHNVQTLEAQLPTVEQLKQELEEAKRRIAEMQRQGNNHGEKEV